MSYPKDGHGPEERLSISSTQTVIGAGTEAKTEPNSGASRMVPTVRNTRYTPLL